MRRSNHAIILGSVLCGLVWVCPALAPADPDALDPVTRACGLPADSADVRQTIVREDPAGFAAAFDSALAAAPAGPLPVDGCLTRAATDYLEVTGDSLLLSDLEFVSSAAPAERTAWYEAVLRDRDGFSLRAAGDFAGSMQAFTEAAEAYRRLGHLRREAVAWGSLGVSVWYTEDMEGVRQAYLKALDARQRLGDPVLIGRTLNGLGSVNLRTGDYDEALVFYDRARAVREPLGNAGDLGTTITYMGHVHYYLGNLEESRACYRRALELLGSGISPRRLNEISGGLANVYCELDEYDHALALYHEVLIRAEKAGDGRMAASARSGSARVRMLQGDHAGALTELVRARAQQEEEGAYHELTTTLNTTGNAYLALGDLPQALATFQEAERLGRESGNELARAQALINKGIVLSQMGVHEAALEAYDEALEANRSMGYAEGVRVATRSKAALFNDQGRYDEALALFREVLVEDQELGLRGDQAVDHGNVGYTLAALGRRDEALEEHRKALALAEAVGLKDALWPCYLNIADCHEQAGALDSALVFNDLAITTLDSQRGGHLSARTRTALTRRSAFVYEAQVQVLAKLHEHEPGAGYAERALTMAERGRARALLEQLDEGNVDLQARMDSNLRAEQEANERALGAVRYRLRMAADTGVPSDSLRALKRRLAELERVDEGIQERVRLEDPAFHRLLAPPPVTPDALRAELFGKRAALLLEYALGDTMSHAWCIGPDRLVYHRLPPRAVIEPKASRLRAILGEHAPTTDGEMVTLAHELYGTLLEPFLPMLEEADIVYIVPDGALSFVPFDVLLTEPPSLPPPREEAAMGAYFRDLPYALADQQVLYGPSAACLLALAERRRERETEDPPMAFLGVGDPVFGSSEAVEEAEYADLTRRNGLDPLPKTREEVLSIADLFPPSRTTVLLGTEATEERLKEPGFVGRFGIVHLATHAVVDLRRPERSCIVLSLPTLETEDGYLQVSEIYDLDLAAELVVLSACQTGFGTNVRGEGVLGLSRAFFHAGAPAMVVSYWSVSDASTARLLAGFYRQCRGEGRDFVEALRRAKQELRKTEGFSHPFHWAPFVFLGVT